MPEPREVQGLVDALATLGTSAGRYYEHMRKIDVWADREAFERKFLKPYRLKFDANRKIIRAK